MKVHRIIYPLVIALAVATTTTGCKHKAGRVTALPPPPVPVANPQPPPTLDRGRPLITDQDPNIKFRDTENTGLRNAPITDFNQMIPDPSALAAYTIHFSFDRSDIHARDRSVNLAAVAAALASDPNTKLTIEGHCDERGTEEYNRALGERRAQAARAVLAELGVDSQRMRTISFGKDKPIDPGHNEEAWAKNRRAEFILLRPPTP